MKHTFLRACVLSFLLFSVAPFSHAETQTPVKKLAVPFFRQQHSLSCEVATLRMALNYHRAYVSEAELIQKLPFDPTPHKGNIWGDPNVGFVGSIDGKSPTTGYGVYWEPIAQLAMRWRRAEVIEQGTVSDLVYHLDRKRPIIMWGYHYDGRPMQWYTPAQTRIHAVHGEHTRTIIGYRGSSNAPEGFYVYDPLIGEQYWSTESLLKNWGSFSNSAVVVYQYPRFAKTPANHTVWEISPDGTTRQALAMTWDSFLQRGYKQEHIVVVDKTYLDRFTQGEDIR